MAFNPKRTARVLFLLLFFSALFSLRLIHLGADPPKDLDPLSPGYYCDPGEYTRNARNKIVLGEWKTDDWGLDYMYIIPLTHYTSYLVFLLFGVGIAQMNVVPVVFSCLTLVLAYLILKKTLNPGFALLGVLLLGVNYPFTMFSRIANNIMPMLFFVCLAIYLLMMAQTKRYFFFVLAGLSCFISLTIKGTALLILPSIVLGMLLHVFFQSGKNLKRTLASLGFFVLGTAITFSFWFWSFYLPNQKLFQDISRDNFARMSPGNWYWVVSNFWTRPLYHLSNVPLITVLTMLVLLFLAYTAFRTPRKIPLLAWVTGFWIVSNYSYLSTVYYRPLRHDIPLILPTVFLATIALFEFYRARHVQKPEQTPFLFYVFFFFWAFFFLSDLTMLKFVPSSWKSMQTYSLRLLIMSAAVTLLLAVVIKYVPRSLKIPLPKLVKTAIIAGFVAMSVFFNLRPYLAWARSPRYDIRNMSRDLGKAYERMSIAGLAAPLVVMENQHTAYGADYHVDEKRDYLQKYHMTHLIIIPYLNEIGPYRKSYPEIMDKARVVARYPIWKTNFELWELYPSSQEKNKDEDLFEGEIFFGRGGIPRYDPAASGRFAFVAEKNQNAAIQLGKFAYLPGRYDVAFFLKMEEIPSGVNSSARMEVIDSDTRDILAFQNASGQDFPLPPSYRAFHLRLVLKRPTNIELRVRNKGDAALFFDKVTLRREAGIDP
jgi:4-amino-4-deoxy-L-arabinose transferase-like glycosyltransferase